MKISLIAAVAENGVIGRDGQLPWRLPADLQHFKAVTLGKPVVMGRKTWQSLGRPLPGRRNIVISRNPLFRAEGAEVFSTFEQALAVLGAAEEVMVIGGGELYRAAWTRADTLYLTRVHAAPAGDTRFPDVGPEWERVEARLRNEDEKNPCAVTFERWVRVQCS